MSWNTVIKGTKYPQDADDARGQGKESVLWIGHGISRAKVPVHAFLVLTVTTISDGLGRLSSRYYVTETTVSRNGDGECLSADRNRVHQAHPVNSPKRRRIGHWITTFWNTSTKRALSGLGDSSSCVFLLSMLRPTPTHPQVSAEWPPPQRSPLWFIQSKAFAPRLMNSSTVFSSPLDSSCHYLQ